MAGGRIADSWLREWRIRPRPARAFHRGSTGRAETRVRRRVDVMFRVLLRPSQLESRTLSWSFASPAFFRVRAGSFQQPRAARLGVRRCLPDCCDAVSAGGECMSPIREPQRIRTPRGGRGAPYGQRESSRPNHYRVYPDRPAGDPRPPSGGTLNTGLRSRFSSIGYRSPQCG